MNTAAPIETLATLADIEIPAPPAPAASLLILGAFILLLATLTALWFFHRRRHEQPPARTAAPELELELADEALQRLDALYREWRAGQTNDRETAYRLCALLRIGMALPGLDPSRPPAGVAPVEWATCLHALHGQRYGARSTAAIDEAAFERLRHWLTAHRAAIAMTATADV